MWAHGPFFPVLQLNDKIFKASAVFNANLQK